MTRTGQYRSWISAIHKNETIRTLALGMLLAAALGAMTTAQAQTYTILYSFKGAPIPDAASPQGDLIRDTKGNLYGTTAQGGTAGAGAIFKLDPLGNESVLYNFTGGADGGKPQAGLLQASGGFYGTTYSGGAFGQGVVFKLKGTVETVLHSFGGVDGSHPTAALIHDSAGNMYGTTSNGGATGFGTVFKLTTTGTETVLYSFTGGTDGKFPEGRLVRDTSGNLYGTTSEGGVVNCKNFTVGCGVVFKLDATGAETVLYSFGGTSDGAEPRAGLIRDSAGNLYGTTYAGGATNCPFRGSAGCGVVFKVSKTLKETVLHSFINSDASNPVADLIRDSAGNLYGTTNFGGLGFGTVFKVSSAGTETTMYSFMGTPDGVAPLGGLIRDSAGNLYGTTSSGGTDDGPGIVFKITP
jgi:uncharacterized repeat protein (TIGR03803 family)